VIDADVRVNLVDSVDDAAALMRWLGERRNVLAFDTETEGLHWWKMNCRLAQFGDTMTAWAIPFERWSGVVEEVFRRYEGRISGHNIRFDARFMHHHGIDVGLNRLDDTMLKANALWPDEKLALKDLGRKHLDAHAADGQTALDEAMNKGGWTWATVPVKLPQYWAYGGLDTVLTARLDELMTPMLHAAGLNHVYELECAVSNVLFGMETRGAPIDVAFCERKYAELLEYSRSLRAWCQDNYGVSPTSADEVISRLQQDRISFTRRTAQGRLKLDEAVLSAIEHPLAEAVLYVRKAEKVAGTYFRNFLELHDNGIIHCSVKQVGARTGRMSITEPALQTLPRDNKIVRNAFIPSPGNKLVSIDYKQIEMRIFAHFAEEREMIHRIKDLGMDMHDAVAATIYGIPPGEPIPHLLRQITKNANFAKVYGAGARKFALTAGITEEEGVAFYQQYDATFPGVRRFQRELEGVARQRLATEGRAYVRAPSGRLHVMDEQTLYKGVNYLVQGTAADVLKEKLVALELSGFGESMVLPVHDEVIFNFPEGDAVELTREASVIMEDRDNWLVPLDVDASPPLDRWEKV
jgi:DNA polymerase I-like protein with 3'-5' exonuclease and polymerase domains